jgi:hypothetical protein
VRPVLAILLAGLMVLSGCAKGSATAPALTPLQIVANAENDIPQVVAQVANTSTALVNQGSLSAAEGATISKILTDIINANTRAVAATQAVTTLTTQGNPTIAAIITPIIQEVQASIQSGDVYNIKNAAAKTAIVSALSGLVITLQLIQSKVGS